MTISLVSTAVDTIPVQQVTHNQLSCGLIRLTNGQVIPIEYLLNAILKDEITRRTKLANLHSNLLNIDQKNQETQEEERLQKGKVLINETQVLNSISKVEKVTTTAALAIGGAIALISGITPIAIFSLACGSLLTLDTILDDTGKNQLVKWIANGDEKEEFLWKDRITTVISLVSIASSFGVSGPPIIQIGLKVAETATSIIKHNSEQKVNSNKADLIELDYLCDSYYKRKIENRMNRYQEETRTVHDLTMKLFDAERDRHKVINKILRRSY